MTDLMKFNLAFIAVVALANPTWSQEPTENGELESSPKVLDSAQQTADAVVDAIDKDEQAQKVTAGILKPIYQLAESFSFPAFHWLAFALMAAGVVSFALQLTLGKLAVLAKFGFSLSEILSDALGLIVSLLGLVLTTQAAAENSTFTSSAAAVLSSAGVGIVFGFVFYIWGQRQELQAVEGRRSAAALEAAQKREGV